MSKYVVGLILSFTIKINLIIFISFNVGSQHTSEYYRCKKVLKYVNIWFCDS